MTGLVQQANPRNEGIPDPRPHGAAGGLDPVDPISLDRVAERTRSANVTIGLHNAVEHDHPAHLLVA